MTSCNKVYIFCPGGLQAKANVYKLGLVYNPAHTILTNLIVLAEGTAQGAAGKKDGSAAAKNCYKRLFPKVKACKGNSQVGTFAAKACVKPLSSGVRLHCGGFDRLNHRTCRTVHPASPWALAALFIKLVYLQQHTLL